MKRAAMVSILLIVGCVSNRRFVAYQREAQAELAKSETIWVETTKEVLKLTAEEFTKEIQNLRAEYAGFAEEVSKKVGLKNGQKNKR